MNGLILSFNGLRNTATPCLSVENQTDSYNVSPDPVEDFIARGGSIKRGPTLVADGVRFWSPCSQPKLGEARPLQVIDFKAGVSAFFANPGRDRYNQARKAEFQARKELALTLSSNGLTAREIAEKMGVPRRTINEYLKGTK
jgi:hypothetical protein